MAAERSAFATLRARLGLQARLDALWIVRGFREAAAWYVADTMIGVASVTGIWLLAERFDGIGSWSKVEVLFMLGFGMLARSLVELLFGWNVGFISRRIGRGQLDHLLLQPAPLWLSLGTEGFGPVSASGGVLFAVVLLVYAVVGLGVELGPAWIGLAVLNLVASVAVLLAFAYAWGSLAFFAPRAAEEINSQTWRMMDQLRVFPLDGAGLLLQAGLTTVVPVAFVAWLPARALLPGSSTAAAFVAPLAALAAGAIAIWIFQRGLEHYGRVGSSRYLDWGHRR